jgi:hypothetical protein
MMIDNELKEFESEIKRGFDRSVAALDGHTLSRISQARNSALESKAKQEREFTFWIPASAVAAVFMALVVYNVVPKKPVEQQSFIDEIDIISNLELYENLDFYEWLELHELPS